MAIITLTTPLTAEGLRAAHAQLLRGIEDPQLEVWLRIQERALRSQYRVLSTAAECDVALADAMIASWPSFMQQVRQVAQETASVDSHQVTYNRPGVIDFAFPAFVGSMVSEFVEEDDALAAPTTTELVREY